MRALRLVVMTVLLLPTCVAPSQTNEPATNFVIDFCNLRVDEIHRRMSGVLSVQFQFRIAEDGIPSDITAIDNTFVEDSEARACIAGWRFGPALHGKSARAVFTWKHEVGWTQLGIEAPDFAQKITISGERCPYGR